MKVAYIYFDNDLDIAPGPDEELTYSPGDRFIKHWNTSTSPRELLRMYNVRFVREIDFARHVPVLHSNPPTNKGPIPGSFPHTINPVASCPTESWAPNNFNNNVQEDIIPDPTAFDPTPALPKLNEICICEDTPDPTCPIHRGRTW